MDACAVASPKHPLTVFHQELHRSIADSRRPSVPLDSSIDDPDYSGFSQANPETSVTRAGERKYDRFLADTRPARELDAVKTDQSVLRSQPQISRRILRDGPYPARWKALPFVPRVEAVLDRSTAKIGGKYSGLERQGEKRRKEPACHRKWLLIANRAQRQ
jgi:hypothetical protein